MVKNAKPFSVHLISLGCAKNLCDTETVLAGLPKGTRIVESPEEADAVVINTCAFINDAKTESVNTILDVADLKTQGTLKRLLVMGCLSQRFKEELANELPEVDRFFGTRDLKAVIDDLNQTALGLSVQDARVLVSDPDRLGFDWSLPRSSTAPKGQAWIKIAEGCSNRCHYCVIPSVRGPLRSRPMQSILEEARKLADQGVAELNVIAQDITLYGSDLGPKEPKLIQLIDNLEALDFKWIRLLYAYPRAFPDGVLERMANSDKILKYLDIPLQHISNNVLKSMGRSIDGTTARARIEELRKRVPGIVLRTTLMVGHPGETEEDFEELLQYVKDARFEHLGVFAYSQEEGTKSGDREDQIPEEIKEERRERILEAQQEISREWLESQIGETVDVLIEGPSDESPLVLEGRTKGQAPGVDGVTYIGLDESLTPGKIVKATITDATDYDLAAELVDEE